MYHRALSSPVQSGHHYDDREVQGLQLYLRGQQLLAQNERLLIKDYS